MFGDPPAIVQQVVSSNAIWNPNEVLTVPQTITTTGTGINDYPTHWYQPFQEVTIIPTVVTYPQPAEQPNPFTINPLPVVTVPQVTVPELNFEQMMKLIEALKAGAVNPKPVEPEEEAKPVERKYRRVVEP